MKLVSLIPALRRALAEIVWIFIGITLALMFQNWNTDREHRRQEVNLLAELYRDLEETRLDLERDIASNVAGLNNAKVLIGAFDDPTVTEEQFSKVFVQGIFGGALYPKTSSYESIKTIGMDLIESDELRKAIADLHELSLARVLTSQEATNSYERLYQEYARTLFTLPGEVQFVTRKAAQAVDTAFEVVETPNMVPVDFDALRRNHGLKVLLTQSFNVLSALIARYRNLAEEIVLVQDSIAAELHERGRQLVRK